MTETAPAPTPLNAQLVELAVTPAEAVAANRSQRLRTLAMLETLTDEQWATRSRCAEWTVQDVVRHVVDICDLAVTSVAVARAGERLEALQGFNPKATPSEWLLRTAGESPAETLARFRAGSEAIIDLIDSLPTDDPESLRLMTPMGKQPWHRAVLHFLFDALAHERDIAVPLGLSSSAPESETLAVARYQLLLVGRVLSAMGQTCDIGLDLVGAGPVRLLVEGARVEVTGDIAAAPRQLTADAMLLLDAVAGRCEMDAVLDGPAAVQAALGVLHPFL